MLKAERICKNCGKIFYVEDREQDVEKNSYRILCTDCINSLSKQERQKLYSKRRDDKEQEERTCLYCGNTFFVKKSKKETSRRKLFCDDCNKLLTPYQKKKIKMDKDPTYREHVLQGKRESHKRNIVHNMWKRAKSRAEKYGYDFNIEESDIIIPEVCPLLGIKIFCGDKDDYESSPSLDRIDNSKGYIKGNVWVISKKANSMKNSASAKELATFCQNIKRYSLTLEE